MFKRGMSGICATVLLLTGCGSEEETAHETSRRAPVEDAAQQAGEEGRSLLDVIEAEPRFSTLREVLDAADLLTTFEEQGPLTLFAPSNEAFAKLPEGYSIEVLSAPENQELLRRILAYHVVSGRIEASDIIGRTGDNVTLTGDPLAFDGTGTVPTVGSGPGDAVVTIPNIGADNGVIHVIDSILLPPV